jgi:hypothetical protein
MSVRSEKEPILKAAGYVYDFNRLAYYNRAAKKAFTIEWVEDNDEDDLRRAIAERNDGDEWRFYSEPQPSRSVKEAFLAQVNG